MVGLELCSVAGFVWPCRHADNSATKASPNIVIKRGRRSGKGLTGLEGIVVNWNSVEA